MRSMELSELFIIILVFLSKLSNWKAHSIIINELCNILLAHPIHRGGDNNSVLSGVTLSAS